MSQVAIIAASAAVMLGLGAFLIWKALAAERKRGAAEAERDQYQTMTEQARRANAIDEDVARLSDPDLDRELRDGG
jgi:ABC-type nickel/cobalt efflux system permease component RcnA